MGSFWSSPEKVDVIRLVFQWTSIICGAIAIIFATRFSTLKKLADSEKATIELAERSSLKDKIHETKSELESTKDKLNKAEKGIAKLIKIDSQTPARNVKLPASGKFTYVKTDNSANTVKITTSVSGQTLLGGLDSYELSVQGESVTLEFSGSNWFKIY